ncbi:unnamed protein product [Protopolystoma xenopodis]|uniref:BTB domain-containing protein n=1 Tax=Protopolystoma xenopodis TaxID=117903 RepID=A0A448XGX1_9PLAT|nr:unnamed protein product [Protopolystoma xenopodis]
MFVIWHRFTGIEGDCLGNSVIKANRQLVKRNPPSCFGGTDLRISSPNTFTQNGSQLNNYETRDDEAGNVDNVDEVAEVDKNDDDDLGDLRVDAELSRAAVLATGGGRADECAKRLVKLITITIQCNAYRSGADRSDFRLSYGGSGGGGSGDGGSGRAVGRVDRQKQVAAQRKMPSPKKGSPGTKSPAQSKASPAGKKSPKKGDASKKAVPEVEVEEDEVVVPVCEGIMHRRMRYILETTLKSDVDFLLGPDDSITTIKAHKCMLQAESPIFEKLFNECDEFKARVIRQHEEEMRLDRERDREMEVAVKLQESQKSVTAASTAGKKKSPEKKEKRPSGRKTPEKKSPEKSPKKSPGQKKSSPPKKKEDRGASGQKVGTEGEVENKINFHQDVVEGLDLIRIRDVHPLGFYRLLRYIIPSYSLS